jgi:hypothetical protein
MQCCQLKKKDRSIAKNIDFVSLPRWGKVAAKLTDEALLPFLQHKNRG